MYARLAFGMFAVFFAAVCLVWHGSDTWQLLSPIPPASRTIVVWAISVVQIAGGVALLHPRFARLGAVLTGVVFAIFALLCIPAIVRAPAVYASIGNLFEKICVVCGALAAFAASRTTPAGAARLRAVARTGLGLCAVSFAVSQIVYLQFTASLVPSWIPPSRMFWAVLTTIAFLLAAVAILIDRRATLAIRLMALMMGSFGVLVWIPQVVAHPSTLANWSELADTFLLAAAAWTVGEARAGRYSPRKT